MKRKSESRLMVLDDVIMIILTLVSAILLFLELTTPLSAYETAIFDSIDMIIAFVFLGEFFVRLSLADSKRTFFKQNWWYLFASIPLSVTAIKVLRLLRLVRLVRLLRIHQGLTHIHAYSKQFVHQTHVVSILTAWIAIILIGTLSFYFFEHTTNNAVHTLFDSLWWTMSTVTTVGYGDIFPITVGGRIVGMLLMVCGIGTTGLSTALVASFFIKKRK